MVVLSISMTNVVWGQTLYEGFDYTTPGNVGGTASAAPFGSNNNWTTHLSTTAGTINLVAGSLSYSGLETSTGNRINIPGTNVTVPRDINRSISGSGAIIAYYSFLLSVLNNTQLGTSHADAGYFMHFCNSSGTSAAGFYGRVSIRSVNSGSNFRLGISNSSGGAPTYTDVALDLSFGTTYLIVVKHDFNGASNDISTIWINPSSLGGTEPSGGTSNSSGTTGQSTFAAMGIRNAGATPNADIDEIRVGTTWASVTPIPSVCSDISITTQPSNASVISPAVASFSVGTSGSVSSHQWQVNTGSGWNDLSNGSPYSGVSSATLNINPTTESMTNYQYRCVITAQGSCNGATSDVATLTVNPAPCISESFTNIPTNSSSYSVRNWTGDNGGAWSASEARTDQQINSSRAICIKRDGILTSPTVSGGIGSLQFTTNFPFGESVGDLEIRVNGILVRTILFSEMSGNTPVTFTINNINQSGNAVVTFTSTVPSGTPLGTGPRFSIDNVTWSCYTGCTQTQTITGFVPAEGPVGTIVTISGTGFTGSTGVKFGDISSSSFTVIDDNTIKAEVPANAISALIGITNSLNCEKLSGAEFTILTNNNSCGVGITGTDLMISEVFDSNDGSIGYIEIFNPTSSAINLEDYYIRLINDNGTVTTNLSNFSSFSLNSGAVAVIRIGDPSVPGSTLCPSVSLRQSFNTSPGVNTDDQIILMKGVSGAGSVLDQVQTPSTSKGYTQLRKNGIINPSISYNAAEWTNFNLEACGNLGIAPTALTSVDLAITANPIDNTSCSSVSFSVSATASTGTISSYLWKYNDSKSMSGWLDASGLSAAFGTNTETLTLAGNFADYQDYQFYCVITKTISGVSCERYSNAAQYKYSTKAYYRSKKDGQWTDASSWEMSDEENGTYINACQYPIALNSTKVNILNTHDIILDPIDINIDWLNIQSGGSLKIESSSLLSFNDGNISGSDLEVDGTLTDNGSNTKGVSFNTGASWRLGTNATIIRTNRSSSSVYQDNYHLGIVNIPATANWIIRYMGANDISFTTVNMFYPNLTIESTSGAWTPSLAPSKFTGSSGFTTVKGNMDVGGAGPGTVSIANINTNANPFLILGNLNVKSGNSLSNTDGSVTIGTGFEIRGNVTVNGTLTVNGNASTGKLILSGSMMQTISGTGTMNLQDVEINNTKSDPPTVSVTPIDYGVTLQRSISMNGVLTLTDGLINTSLTNLLTLTSSASSTPGSDASFVNGPIKKFGNTVFSFPVGKPVQTITASVYNPSGLTGGWRPLSISAPGNIADAFTAEFMHFNANLIGTITSPGLQGVSACEYWGLKRESSTDVNVTLTWKQKSICTPSAYVANAASVVVAVSSNGTPLTHPSGNWTNHGGSGTITAAPYEGSSTWNTVPVAYYKNSALTNYAGYTPFTLGTTNWQQAPLPYTLSTFKASPKDKIIELDWQVLHNDQVKSYTVERSKDGLRFTPLKHVAARANEQHAAYTDVDPAPIKGWSYYRLRITDINGNSTYSSVQKVWLGNTPVVQVSPNPVKDQLFINSGNTTVKEISLVNYLGQTLLRKIPIGTSTILDLSKLNSGVYYVRILTNEGVLTEQVIKQ